MHACVKCHHQLFYHNVSLRYRQFIFVHPGSVYYGDPHAIQVGKHIVCYQKLLETNKVYLCARSFSVASASCMPALSFCFQVYVINSLTAPVVHTLLLCCHSLDTNGALDTVLADGWALLEFSDSAACTRALGLATWLRCWIALSVKAATAAFTNNGVRSAFTSNDKWGTPSSLVFQSAFNGLPSDMKKSVAGTLNFLENFDPRKPTYSRCLSL